MIEKHIAMSMKGKGGKPGICEKVLIDLQADLRWHAEEGTEASIVIDCIASSEFVARHSCRCELRDVHAEGGRHIINRWLAEYVIRGRLDLMQVNRNDVDEGFLYASKQEQGTSLALISEKCLRAFTHITTGSRQRLRQECFACLVSRCEVT